MSFVDKPFIPIVSYFVERRATPTWIIAKDTIDFFDLTYIYGGQATYFVDGIKHEVSQGNIIYIPKGCCREAFTHPDNLMHSFAFNFNIFSFANNPNVLNFPIVFNIKPDIYFINLLNEFNQLWLEKKEGFMLKATGIFMIILHYLSTHFAEQADNLVFDIRIEKIKTYVIDHYSENINRESLAQLVNLNPVYLGSLFKKKTGYTINEYINRIRINQAFDLLSTGGYKVTEVAYRCGFNDVFYFSKIFKKLIGRSPSEVK